MAKYLMIKLKTFYPDVVCKKYAWDEIDFTIDDNSLTVRELSSGELLFYSLFENIEYIERIEE